MALLELGKISKYDCTLKLGHVVCYKSVKQSTLPITMKLINKFIDKHGMVRLSVIWVRPFYS